MYFNLLIPLLNSKYQRKQTTALDLQTKIHTFFLCSFGYGPVVETVGWRLKQICIVLSLGVVFMVLIWEWINEDELGLCC